MKRLVLLILLIALCGCERYISGSTTSDRPALNRPAIGPDGAFWDAAVVAGRGERDAFLYLLSPQFVHRALFPEDDLDEITTQGDFDEQRGEIEERLADYEPVVDRLARRYMRHLAELVEGRLVEVGRPRYNIDYTDTFDRAEGPNRATVTVTVYPKSALGEDIEPEVFEVDFIMDGRRWLIDGFDPDPMKGSFAR